MIRFRGNRLLGLVVTTFAISLVPMTVLAEERDALELLERMSETIAGLDRFQVEGDAYADRRLPEGQLIAQGVRVTMRVRRPGSMRITVRTTENTKEIYFSEGMLTLYSETDRFYGQTEIPPEIGAAFDVAVNEIGIDAPLLDFVAADLEGKLLVDADQIDYFGINLVAGRAHHHVGIRYPDLDLQLWISAEGLPLPGRMSMTSRWEAGLPRFVAFLNWDTDPDIPSGALVFTPPEGSARIEVLRESGE